MNGVVTGDKRIGKGRMKIYDLTWKFISESFYPISTNIIKRKFEEQKGLDTLVVQTINDEGVRHDPYAFYLRSTVARLKLKGFDGDLYKRWNMLINTKLHAKSYQSLKTPRNGGGAGVAWLSSVRVVKYLVKSINERNLLIVLGTSLHHESLNTISIGK